MGNDLYTYTFMADVGRDTDNDGIAEFDGVMDRITVRPGAAKVDDSFDWEATVEYATNAQDGAKYTAPEKITVEKSESITGLTSLILKGKSFDLDRNGKADLGTISESVSDTPDHNTATVVIPADPASEPASLVAVSDRLNDCCVMNGNFVLPQDKQKYAFNLQAGQAFVQANLLDYVPNGGDLTQLSVTSSPEVVFVDEEGITTSHANVINGFDLNVDKKSDSVMQLVVDAHNIMTLPIPTSGQAETKVDMVQTSMLYETSIPATDQRRFYRG